jgi:molecular chaperone GrpE
VNTNNDTSKPSVSPAAEDTTRMEATAAPAEPAAAPAPIDAITAERDQLRDQLLRTAADFDNYRKRARREMEEAKLRGKDDAIKEVLPVFDNLERAVAAADSAQTIASVVEGVKMVLKLFEDTAERMGLKRIVTVGERFDPAVHEAIQQQETDVHPPGTILTEVVPGYMIGSRLLRAAMVTVARKPNKPASEGDNGVDGNAAKGGGANA